MKKISNFELFIVRTKAFLYDFAIVILFSVLISIMYSIIVLNLGNNDSSTMSIGINLVSGSILIFYLVYLIICELRFNGQTYGKKKNNIKVISTNGTNELNTKQIVMRNIIKLMPWILNQLVLLYSTIILDSMDVVTTILNTLVSISVLILIASFAVTKENQGIHNVIAKTKVVVIEK